MPTRIGPALVPEPTVALVERLDPGRRATIDAWFARVTRELGSFRRGDRILRLLKRCLEEPIYAGAPSDVAWSVFVGRLNDELFEDRLLSEADSLAFWRIVFSPAPVAPPEIRH